MTFINGSQIVIVEDRKLWMERMSIEIRNVAKSAFEEGERRAIDFEAYWTDQIKNIEK